MLAIRMQRLGRKGHAQYRMIVQDSHRAPTSGKVVTYLGSYNPHTKTANLDKEKAQTFLNNGAQPSDRAARLLKDEGVKLPKWFEFSEPGKRETRNPEKLRRNQPEQPKEEASEQKPAESEAGSTEEKVEEQAPEVAEKDGESSEVAPEAPKESSEADKPAEEKPAEESVAEKSDEKSEESETKEA